MSKSTIVFLLFCLSICPAVGQNATVSVGQPVSIAVRLHHATVLQGQASHELSAVGFMWHTNDHRIYYIDRNSDLLGKACLGDIYMGMDGLSPEQASNSQHYLNNENTPVQVQIWHNSTIYTVTAYRHPISTFGPAWHPGMGY